MSDLTWETKHSGKFAFDERRQGKLIDYPCENPIQNPGEAISNNEVKPGRSLQIGREPSMAASFTTKLLQ